MKPAKIPSTEPIPLNCAEKAMIELKEQGYIHTAPGMYSCYKGPGIGHYRLNKGGKE